MQDTRAMRVVIVDDNPGDVLLLRDTLEDAGYTHIQSCGTSVELMEHVNDVTTLDEHVDIDLVFLDVRLPDANGFALCERIKQEISPFLPVIMLTGLDSVDDQIRGTEAGADAFISKPFEPARLLARLKQLLDRKLRVDPLITATRGVSQSAESATPEPDTIGDYIVLGTLSWSANTVVHKVEKDGITYALKIVAPEARADTATMDHFLRETDCLQSLRHPHLVQVMDAGFFCGAPFCVMEFVDGEDLRRYLRHAHPISMAELRRIAIQACAAIAYIHKQGVIHRDIKPSNLFRTATGDIKLGDFGVALQTRDARPNDPVRAVGTPLYMAPEQFRNIAVGPTADIYAFGATMFHLITGQPPFVADSAMQLFHMHRNVEPPTVHSLRDDAPESLDRTIAACLAKQATDRPPSMPAVLEGLWK